jgi:hypothetical protein
MGAVAAIGY